MNNNHQKNIDNENIQFDKFKSPTSIRKLSAEKLSIAHDVNCVSLFAVIADQPWAMWLDSCDSQHQDCCYDIMVWQPLVTLTTKGDNTKITNKLSNEFVVSKQDPLTLVKQQQALAFENTQIEKSSLPFLGGTLGYFAYDLGKRFEKLPTTTTCDINIPDMAVGIYQQAIIYDRQHQQFWLFCEQCQRQTIERFFTEQLSLKQSEKSAWQNMAPSTAFQLEAAWQSNMSAQQYHEKFAQVQQHLSNGDCYQINLAQRFSAPYSGNEFDAYLKLRTENNAPFSAFLRFENSAILSISPERFLQLKENKIQTKPIKGTRPRHIDAIKDQQQADELRQSEKDRAENIMIVDLLRNDISKVCKFSSVKVPELFAIESFSAVHHLVSTIEGDILPEYDATDLLRATFPGGSITGAPKIKAMEIIDNLEPHIRSVYCGSIGYIASNGNMDTNIAIRTLVCHDQKIHCWAGGGIVVDSNVDSEYQETYDKVNKILPVLAKYNKITIV